MAELVEAEDAEVTAGTPAHLPFAPRRGWIAAVAEELGLRRARVLSRYGLHVAADRWEESYGPKTAMAQAAPASCVSCGFLNPIGGSLGQAFGICANEFSPARMGASSRSPTAVEATPRPRSCPSFPRPAPPVIDETRVDPFPLRPSPDSGLVPLTPDETAAELGQPANVPRPRRPYPTPPQELRPPGGLVLERRTGGGCAPAHWRGAGNCAINPHRPADRGCVRGRVGSGRPESGTPGPGARGPQAEMHRGPGRNPFRRAVPSCRGRAQRSRSHEARGKSEP